MKLALRFAAILSLGLAGAAFAHPGHDHEPVTRAVAEAKAKTVVQAMVRQKLLEASWSARPAAAAELRDDGGGQAEWRVTFRNPAAKVTAKRTLFVFLAEDGGYLTSNHTGN